MRPAPASIAPLSRIRPNTPCIPERHFAAGLAILVRHHYCASAAARGAVGGEDLLEALRVALFIHVHGGHLREDPFDVVVDPIAGDELDLGRIEVASPDERDVARLDRAAVKEHAERHAPLVPRR